MEQTEKLLKDYSDLEKGSYLGAIASIATADRTASEEELEYIEALADSAQLSPEQKEAVQKAATELSGEELQACLNNLKGSELRFSLVTDLIAFAESDQNYTQEEKENIEKISRYHNINKEQFSLLNQFVQKTAEAKPEPEQMQQQGFLGSLGLEEKFKNSGIDFGSLTKGLLGIAGPMILGSLLSRGTRGRGGGGGLGGMLPGGLGGMLSSGGLGSLTSMLNGGRGIGSAGGLLRELQEDFKFSLNQKSIIMKPMTFKLTWVGVVLCLMSFFQLQSCKGKNKDAEINTAIQSKTQTDASFAGVNATVADGVVTLTGQCNDDNCKTNAENAVKDIDGVKKVVNNITVVPVAIAPDNTLNTSVASVVAKYPGVSADINDGVITLRGQIKRDSLQQLMMDLNALNPKKVENQLVIK